MHGEDGGTAMTGFAPDGIGPSASFMPMARKEWAI